MSQDIGIFVTTQNFETLIKEKKIKFDDLKTLLNKAKVENIYYEMIIKSYFGYDKYIELLKCFQSN